MPMVDMELHRRGLNTYGVREAIVDSWAQYQTSEAQYSELFQPPPKKCHRSNVSTAAAMREYASYFSPDSTLSSTDVSYIIGAVPEPTPLMKSNQDRSTKRHELPPVEFASRASRLGLPVIRATDQKPQFSLSNVVTRKIPPPGFEMINEDMFARKNNKFMVFNGPGADTFQSKPVTKISRLEDTLLTTLD